VASEKISLTDNWKPAAGNRKNWPPAIPSQEGWLHSSPSGDKRYLKVQTLGYPFF